jgi:L-threonylcarbamoyladenylate synthase
VKIFRPTQTEATPESLPSPGVGIRHYAPRARLVLVNGDAELSAAITEDAGVMLPEGWSPGVAKAVFPWGPWNDADTLARRLFAGLRQLDESGVPVIVCPVPEMGGLGDAIRDRLKKAAREK